MPEKRDGYTQISLQVPDDLLAAVTTKRGGVSLTAYLCGLMAKDTKTGYTRPKMGRPKGKPAKKGRKP